MHNIAFAHSAIASPAKSTLGRHTSTCRWEIVIKFSIWAFEGKGYFILGCIDVVSLILVGFSFVFAPKGVSFAFSAQNKKNKHKTTN